MGEKDDKRTMRQVRLMANSILPFIQMKEEVASDCPEEKLPMLDFRVWKENKENEEGEIEIIIHHEFYEKPMSSKLVMMERSALPTRMKITTLTQEIIRRQKNTSRSVGEKRRRQILSKMMVKMKRSGYDLRMRRRVLVAGMKGYQRMVETEEKGGRQVNRPRWEGATERRFKKLGAKANWYKKKGRKRGGAIEKRKGDRKKGKAEESDIEAVLFVPYTPEGELAKRLQEEDDRFRKGTNLRRIKVVERGGITIKDVLARTNPWVKEGCSRSDCLPCKWEKGKGGNCQQENVVYSISCLECRRNNIKAEYTGESSRTAYLRGKEHIEGLENEKEKNALWKHCCQEHGMKKVDFSMKVLRGHKTPLTRQIQEGVEIEFSEAKIIMNSKGEWNGSRIPRIVIEVGEDVLDDDDDPLETSSKKRRNGDLEKWRMKSLNKRKTGDEIQGPRSKRRREIGPEIMKWTECGNQHNEVKPKEKEIVTGTTEQLKSESGPAQHSDKSTPTKHATVQCPTRKISECGTAQPKTRGTAKRNIGEKPSALRKWLRITEGPNFSPKPKNRNQEQNTTIPKCGPARPSILKCGPARPSEPKCAKVVWTVTGGDKTDQEQLETNGDERGNGDGGVGCVTSMPSLLENECGDDGRIDRSEKEETGCGPSVANLLEHGCSNEYRKVNHEGLELGCGKGEQSGCGQAGTDLSVSNLLENGCSKTGRVWQKVFGQAGSGPGVTDLLEHVCDKPQNWTDLEHGCKCSQAKNNGLEQAGAGLVLQDGGGNELRQGRTRLNSKHKNRNKLKEIYEKEGKIDDIRIWNELWRKAVTEEEEKLPTRGIKRKRKKKMQSSLRVRVIGRNETSKMKIKIKMIMKEVEGRKIEREERKEKGKVQEGKIGRNFLDEWAMKKERNQCSVKPGFKPNLMKPTTKKTYSPGVKKSKGGKSESAGAKLNVKKITAYFEAIGKGTTENVIRANLKQPNLIQQSGGGGHSSVQARGWVEVIKGNSTANNGQDRGIIAAGRKLKD